MKKKCDWNYLILILLSLLLIILVVPTNALFGSSTDWLNQHSVFPNYFREQFYQTGNLFPNFASQIGAGQNIFNFAYYGLFSPIILFSYFLPFLKMVDYLMLSSILLYLASGLLFYRFLLNHTEKKTIAFVTSCLFLLTGPLLFHFHRHLMFVNYMPFLLLALLGVDHYFKNGRRLFLTIAVFLMILTSFYYSVGGIIAIVIYGIYAYLEKHKEVTIRSFIKDGIQFLLPILCAVMMAFFLLLPTYYAIKHGTKGEVPPIDLVTLFIPRFELGSLLYDSYSIGYTAIAFVALIGGFFTKKKHQLFFYFILVSLLLFPIFLAILNGGLYLRPKVLIPFSPLFGLAIASFFENLTKRKIPILFLIVAVIVVNLFFFATGYRDDFYYWDLGIVIVSFLIYAFFKKEWLVYLPVLAISVCSCYGMNKEEEFVSKKQYQEIYDQRKEELILDTLKEDPSFYRFANFLDTGETINQVYHPRYYQTTLYSSMDNAYYHDFYYFTFQNAMAHRNNLMISSTNNILFETFMGIKYILTSDQVPLGYRVIKESGPYKIIQNENVRPLGYVETNLMGQKQFSNLSALDQITALLSNVIINKEVTSSWQSKQEENPLLGTAVIDPNIQIEKIEGGYQITAFKDAKIIYTLKEPLTDILYIEFAMPYSQSCKKGDTAITINGITNKLTCKEWMYHNQNYQFHYMLSSATPTTKLELQFTKGTYQIKDGKTAKIKYDDIKYGNHDSWQIDAALTKGDHMEGSIDVKEKGYFTTSIPYSEGFEVKVDGKVVSYERVNEAFLGFPIEKGTHQVEINFKASYSRIGQMGSLIGWIGCGFLVWMDRKKRK